MDSFFVNPSGGTPFSPPSDPYLYDWDTTISLPQGGNQSSYINLEAGTYGVTIKDANGCTSTDVFALTQPDQLQNYFTITDVSCNGLSDGVITPNTSGGTGAYQYIGASVAPANVSAGTYVITIKDANNCTIKDTAIVAEFNPLEIEFSSNINYGEDPFGNPYYIQCYGGSNSEVLAYVVGGTGGGTYGPYNWYDASNTLVLSTPNMVLQDSLLVLINVL